MMRMHSSSKKERARLGVGRTPSAWACAAAMMGISSLAGCERGGQESEVAEAKPGVVETAPTGSFISVSGTVSQTGPDQFRLDYGAGEVTVEMAGWSWYPQGHAALLDDEVVVYGYVDDAFYEKRTIEASSVYVSDLGTQFYASHAKEGDFPVVVSPVGTTPQLQLRGTVTGVEGDEFQLDTGAAVIDVNTEKMLYDPLDDEGFQRIRKNDRVSVTGDFGYEFFTDLDLMASSVVTLQSSEQKNSEQGSDESI